VAEVLAAMMPPGVPPLRLFRTVARSPRLLGKLRAASLLGRGSPLDRRDRELAILRTCARCGAEYEWGVHVTAFAARVGLDEARVRATAAAGGDDPVWSDRERAIVRTVDALHDGASVPDGVWRDLAAHFDDAQCLELLFLAGFYHTVSFLVNALRVEPEEGAARLPTADAA
jgi:alkylhydroperoxidase family enzyme